MRFGPSCTGGSEREHARLRRREGAENGHCPSSARLLPAVKSRTHARASRQAGRIERGAWLLLPSNMARSVRRGRCPACLPAVDMSLSKENEMTTRRLTAALAVAIIVWTGSPIIVWTASPALAQDTGKTEAAKLASESRAALQNLSAGVPLAKELEDCGGILVFPSVTKAGLGIAAGRSGRAVLELLQDHGRVLRVAGRRAKLRRWDVLHERGCRRRARRREGFRSWCRPEHRDGGRGHGEEQHDPDP